jgi:hypothetical protein
MSCLYLAFHLLVWTAPNLLVGDEAATELEVVGSDIGGTVLVCWVTGCFLLSLLDKLDIYWAVYRLTCAFRAGALC